MESDFTQLASYMKPFPKGETVFAHNIEQHLKHFQPLLTIELNAVRPDWSGVLHFVTPKEPCDGVVGQSTHEYHNYYSRENCVAFRVQNGQYEFLGDFRYFELENHANQDLSEHYRAVEDSLIKTQTFYNEHGILNPWNQADNPQNWVEELNAPSWWGNWTDSFPYEEVGEEVYPITEDGRRFTYIGCLAGYSYREHGADGVLLFYDEVEQIALFIFDWT